jgi:DNA-binding CsgD family transcriptional regulator
VAQKGRLSDSTGDDIFVRSVMPEEIEPQSAEEPTRRDGPAPRRSEESLAPRPISVLNWKLVAWGGLIALLAVAASELVSLWWLVLVFGLLVPTISALQTYWSANRKVRPAIRPQDKEGELLGALGELGELTPTTAAMRTTLTVEEAAQMLEKLARKGHLEARTQGAVVIYGLWEPDRREPDQSQTAPAEPVADHGGGPVGALGNEVPVSAPPNDQNRARSSVPPLVEPLTERENEVFELLASGRTNREIAADLFVTVGTIKAHTSNIYAKLQARNRAEAISRARELGWLD